MPQPAAAEQLGALEAMATMRAMRRLKPDPVPDQLHTQLIAAASYAPSTGNEQAQAFIVVTDRPQMTRLAALWRRCVDTYLDSFGRSSPGTLDADALERVRRAVRYQRDHFHETPARIVPCYALDGGG